MLVRIFVCQRLVEGNVSGSVGVGVLDCLAGLLFGRQLKSNGERVVKFVGNMQRLWTPSSYVAIDFSLKI